MNPEDPDTYKQYSASSVTLGSEDDPFGFNQQEEAPTQKRTSQRIIARHHPPVSSTSSSAQHYSLQYAIDSSPSAQSATSSASDPEANAQSQPLKPHLQEHEHSTISGHQSFISTPSSSSSLQSKATYATSNTSISTGGNPAVLPITSPEEFQQGIARLPPEMRSQVLELAKQMRAGQITGAAFVQMGAAYIRENDAKVAATQISQTERHTQVQNIKPRPPDPPSILKKTAPVSTPTQRVTRSRGRRTTKTDSQASADSPATNHPTLQPDLGADGSESASNATDVDIEEEEDEPRRNKRKRAATPTPVNPVTNNSTKERQQGKRALDAAAADKSKPQLEQELDATHAAGIEEEEEEQRLRSDMVLSEGSGPGHPRPGEDRIRHQGFMGAEALRGEVQPLAAKNRVAKVDEDYIAWLGLATESRIRELIESMVVIAKHRASNQYHFPRHYSEGDTFFLQTIVVDKPQRVLAVAAEEERQSETNERERRRAGIDAVSGFPQEGVQEAIAFEQKNFVRRALGLDQYIWMQADSPGDGVRTTVAGVANQPASAGPVTLHSTFKSTKVKRNGNRQALVVRLQDGLLVLGTQGARGIRSVVQKWSVK
ncbi:hypothetical protein SeLEV6574_g02699 [Synchytrium endobioticum]|uniref:Transcription initiation factor TFIID subunit 4 n=1 Tax=Synchytrium endobioticum TaxID=286115 RepID=A0A507D7C8_9FUNG|nr:hypothetical protein SeLEV6574_g02699 [Synchytrium endobioticum]